MTEDGLPQTMKDRLDWLSARPMQRVGWVEQSETHRIRARPNDGFRNISTHPTALITRCRALACKEDRTVDKRCCKMGHRTAGNSRW
jgi:hypothetical protein